MRRRRSEPGTDGKKHPGQQDLTHSAPVSQRVMLSHSTHGAGKRFAGDKTQIERQRNTRVQIFIVGTYNPSDTEKNKPKKPPVMNLLNGPGESTLGKLTPLNWDDAEIT